MKCLVCSANMRRIPLIHEISRYNSKKYPIYKCVKCGFAAPNPSPFDDHSGLEFYDEGDHIKFFDAKKGDIDRSTKEYKYYYRHSEPYMRFIAKYGIRGSSLDVGCGPGHLLELERDAGLAAEGMEVSPLLTKLLRKQGFKMHTGLLGEAKLGKYDLVTMNQVLEHIPDPEAAIRHVNKALKPKGYFILAVPYIYGIVPRIMRSKGYGLGYGQHVNFFSRKSLRILLERNGFKVMDIELMSVDYAHPKFPSFANAIARFIMRMNVILGLGDNLFVVARKTR